MTDKLSEAIEKYEPLDMSDDNHKRLIEILKAARAHAALPIVNLEKFKKKEYKQMDDYSRGVYSGWNTLLDHLIRNYPGGFRK